MGANNAPDSKPIAWTQIFGCGTSVGKSTGGRRESAQSAPSNFAKTEIVRKVSGQAAESHPLNVWGWDRALGGVNFPGKKTKSHYAGAKTEILPHTRKKKAQKRPVKAKVNAGPRRRIQSPRKEHEIEAAGSINRQLCERNRLGLPWRERGQKACHMHKR